jgi:hypothetical protein
MERLNSIKKIALDTENLNAHLKRVSKPGHQLHPLDLDLMLDKVRLIYDEIIQLYAATPQHQVERNVEPDSPPKQKEQTKHLDVSPQTANENLEIPAIIHAPITTEITQSESNQVIIQPERTEKIVAPEVETNLNSPVYEPAPQMPHAGADSNRIAQRTTLDLFAHNSPDTVGQKLALDEDASIAARMQRKPISDLRSAIGINEKFLFINELFKGNMQQYNKTLDELNDFKSLQGAQTYLLELKVEYQWDEVSQAFKKLREFVERRFGY